MSEASTKQSPSLVFAINGVIIFFVASWLLFSAASLTEYTMTRSSTGFELKTTDSLFGVEHSHEVRLDALINPELRCTIRRGAESCAIVITGSNGEGRFPASSKGRAEQIVNQLRTLVPGAAVNWNTRGLKVSDLSSGQALEPTWLELFVLPMFFEFVACLLLGAAIYFKPPTTGTRSRNWYRIPIVGLLVCVVMLVVDAVVN